MIGMLNMNNLSSAIISTPNFEKMGSSVISLRESPYQLFAVCFQQLTGPPTWGSVLEKNYHLLHGRSWKHKVFQHTSTINSQSHNPMAFFFLLADSNLSRFRLLICQRCCLVDLKTFVADWTHQNAHPTHISWGIQWNFKWYTSGERYQNPLANTVDGPVGLLQVSTRNSWLVEGHTTENLSQFAGTSENSRLLRLIPALAMYKYITHRSMCPFMCTKDAAQYICIQV